MMKFLKQIFTGIDNETLDLGRILWAKISFVFCIISAYHTIKTGQFDPQAWAIGASAIMAGGGGAIALKSKTEPAKMDPPIQ